MSTAIERDVVNDEHWRDFSHQWLIRTDTTYLNHGSFGPPPQPVRQARRIWIDALDSQPMDFYVRELEAVIQNAKSALANFVGISAENLVFVENATYGMNIVADSFELKAGDNVLLNNHEYGAVHRIWNRACQRKGANVVSAKLPEKFESTQQIVDCLLSAANEKTRLVVISHITSPTAIVMPVEEICGAFGERDIPVVVDGPHAPAQIDLNIGSIGCDFYTASCHKWLSASLGSGFLFVAPKWQSQIQPPLKSWGRLLPAVPEKWDEEFTWSGTRDPSAYLSTSTAIDFMTNVVGLENFQQRTRFLAKQAEQMLTEEFGTQTIASRNDGWYASMAHVPLPEGDFSSLQNDLWNEYKIEVPIIHFEEKWFIRVSCHLYNSLKHLETLKFAIRKFLV